MENIVSPEAVAGPSPPTTTLPTLASPRLWGLVGVAFIVLFAAYWFLIRTAYVPVLSNVEPQVAADVVKVLDERKISYRLADNGRTIQVASDVADMARIELVGSELPMRGQVGFELFNQSDMGLTEFAQKINYQRALQGELARTILSLDGIEAVRVHLGLPERSVFRDEQTQPKASVALVLKAGKTLTEGTVVGIQRLVAGSIPGMVADGVSVLDGSGRVVSRGVLTDDPPLTGSDGTLESYRRQIVALISRNQPTLRYDLNLSLRNVPAQAQGDRQTATAANRAVPRGDPDFAINVRMTTPTPLDDGQRLELLAAIEGAIGFDRSRGDVVTFIVGDMVPEQRATVPPVAPDRVVATSAKPVSAESGSPLAAIWPLVVAVAVGLLGFAWSRDRRRSLGRKREDLSTFAEQLRDRLHALPEGAA